MRSLGIVLVITGLIWGIVAFNMNTTVSVEGQTIGSGEYAVYIPGQTVHNLSLSERRNTHLMVSGVLLVIGTILFGFGSARGSGAAPSASTRSCPFCAEKIKIDAIICKHCGKDVPAAQVTSPEPNQTTQTVVKICSSCKTYNTEEKEVCWKCRNQLA